MMSEKRWREKAELLLNNLLRNEDLNPYKKKMIKDLLEVEIIDRG